MEQYKCTKEGEVATLKAENKTIFKEIESLKRIQDIIYDLSKNLSTLVMEMKDTKEDVKSIRQDLDEIKRKPGNDYDNIKGTVVNLIIGAIIGTIMSKLL